MAVKKEPIEIKCSNCEAHFRLWIPVEEMKEWETGNSVNCIRCGAPYLVKKDASGLVVEAMTPKAPEVPAPPVDAEEGAGEPSPSPAVPVLKTVLVVEDDGLSRKMVENTLNEMDFNVIPAKNAEEGLKALRTEKIGLLVVDLYLKNPDDPGSTMDGEDFLAKAVKTGVKVPSIITTGKELIDDMALDSKWFDLNVKGFVQKGNPFWVDELKDKVKSLFPK